MTFRFGAATVVALTLALAGCGGGGAGSAAGDISGATPQALDPEELPQWVQDLPDGTEPTENTHTRAAAIALIRANQADSPEQRETRLQTALEAARAGILEDPGNPQSYLQAGEALMGLEQYREAVEMLDRAEEIYPRYVLDAAVVREEAWIQFYNQGVEHMEAGREAEALGAFEMSHMVYQARPEAMIQAGALLWAMERGDEAVGYFRQAAEVVVSPRSADVDAEMQESWADLRTIALFNMAQILFHSEQFAESAEAYSAILEDDPENLSAMSNLAIALVSAGEIERAGAIYDRLLAQPGLTARDYYVIGIGLYQSEQFPEAARAFSASMERVPNHRDAVFNYAQSLFLAQDWEALLLATERLLELDPNNSYAYRYRAQAFVHLDREQEAVAVLEVFADLPFELDMMQLQPITNGVGFVGQAFNLNQPVGTEVNLRIHFYAVTGESVGTADVTLELGENEVPVVFQAQIQTSADVFGYRYEVL